MTVANWCVLIAIVMPYVCFGITRNRARAMGVRRDNHDPRAFVSKLEGLAKRAWSAHLNAFEVLPAFTAAVLIAQQAGAPQAQVNVLAVAWVVARTAYVAFYLFDAAALRTTVQVVSLACIVALFVVAGMT